MYSKVFGRDDEEAMHEKKEGISLSELLIVVAIIGVLVAVSLPIFVKQVEKSRDAVTLANIRSAYAEAQLEYQNPSPIDRNKRKNAYPSGWIGSGYHLWLNYKGGEINCIDVVVHIENKKAAHELKKMLKGSNLPFEMNTQGSTFPPGNYLLVFNYGDGKFLGTATLMYPIAEILGPGPGKTIYNDDGSTKIACNYKDYGSEVPDVITVYNVVIKGGKRNNWSGLGDDLPFYAALDAGSSAPGGDTGQKGYGRIHFFYDESGKLEKVIMYVNTDKTMKPGIKP